MNVSDPAGLARSLFAESADALLLVDSKSARIADANPAAVRLFDCTHGEIIGRSVDDLLRAVNSVSLADALLRADNELLESGISCETSAATPRHVRVRRPHFEASGTALLILSDPHSIGRDDERSMLMGQERLTRIVETVADGILLVDRDQRVIFANTAAERMTGLPRRSLTSVCWHELHWEPDADAGVRWDPVDINRRVLDESESIADIAVNLRRYNGSLLHLSASFVPLGEGLATATGMVISFTDLTERAAAREQARHSQQALRESEARYRRLFEGNLAGVFRNAPDGRLLECNDACARIYGYASAAEMMTMPLLANNPIPADREAKLAKLRETGRLTNHLSHARHRNGSEIWILENTSVVVEPDGSEVFEGTIIDLTEQKRAAEQLARDHALLRALLQSIPDLIFCKDREGRYLGCNLSFEEYTGIREKDLLGHTSAEVFPAGEAVRHEEEDRQVYALRSRVHIEKWLHHPDGRRLVEMVLTPLLDDDGEILGLLGVGRDITERQRTEEHIRQAAKMEAIGRLAGGIAHDFNNLLTVILGNLSFVQVSPAGSEPAVRAALADAEQAAQRAAELTNQLLGFARRSPLQPEPLDLNRRVEETVNLLRRTIDPRISIEVHAADDLWTVEADRAQISQVLMNLCLNARDAMPDGGRLVLETANIEIAAATARMHLDARPGEFVCLSVRDTGHGIAPDVRARIFEPFFTTKPFGKGTGLGLAMVFGIVHQHKGWVECQSEPDRGTRFDVFLPRSSRAAEEAGMTKVNPEPGRETILIVDDEPMIRDLGRAALQQFGYRVLLADSGLQALEIYRSQGSEIDLVLLDLTMPQLSGYEVLRELRRIDPDVKVVFASGYSADHLDESEAAGVLGFIQKPYRPHELAAAVRAALAGA